MTISNTAREVQTDAAEREYALLEDLFGADAIERAEQPERFVSESEFAPEQRDEQAEADLDWWADRQFTYLTERY